MVALAKTGDFLKSQKFIDNRCICQSNLLSRLPSQLYCVQPIRHDLKQKIYAVWVTGEVQISLLPVLAGALPLPHCHIRSFNPFSPGHADTCHLIPDDNIQMG